MRRFILGTAGHIDHGKTELVKALTGRDTDRLKEEKERGISIELGFAPLKLDKDVFLGIIDVPGHERFIKNMVAGAGGIDVAMLLVAADEGVMPQTKEHLEVLNSLAISHGIVVISKIDLATEDMIEVLKSEIQDLVKGSFLEGVDVIETSVKSGKGIDELKKKLLEICRKIEERDSSGPFRLPVDRVFVSKGIGVVVTGSCYSGTVRIGDYLDLLPQGKKVRVRELQSFNEKRESAHAGERVAVALQGVKLRDVHRGDVLVSPSKFHVSYIVDAKIHLAAYGGFELKNRQRVRIHHGAREVMGRVVLLDKDHMRSAEEALVQLKLEKPIVSGEGDYFVLRRYSPPRVIGGGRVIDPAAHKHKRFDLNVIRHLELLESGDRSGKILRSIFEAGLKGYDPGDPDKKDIEKIINSENVINIEGRLFHMDVLKHAAERARHIALQYNKEHPLLYGIDKEELRQKLGFSGSKALFSGVLKKLSSFEKIYIRGNQVRAESEVVKMSGEMEREVRALEALIKKAGLVFPSPEEINDHWRAKVDLQEALQFLKDEGRIVKIADKGYIHRDALGQIKRRLHELFSERAEISVGDFKSAFDLTRKHAIPLLEYTDEKKITLRKGDSRIKGPNLRVE